MQAARQPQSPESQVPKSQVPKSQFPARPRGHFRFRLLLSGQLLILLGLLPVVFAAEGCGTGESVGVAEQTAETSEPAAASPQAATPAAAPEGAESNPQQAGKVSVSLASWAEILKAAKAEGRPAVLDVWSLGCEPCLKEFPGLVRLHREWGEKLHCVSANIDFDGRKTRPPESYETKVMDFLRLKEATLDNYLCTTPSEEIYTELKIDSIPAVLVFDAEGKEVARFVDAGETLGFTYEKDIIPFVEKLLADDAAPGSDQ